MPASRPERDALLQRLQSCYPGTVATGDNDIILWQGWRIHCTALPSDYLAAPDDSLLELCRLWTDSPLNSGLLVAGTQADVDACQALWLSLSGHEQAWLYCGPTGAAGFCKRVFDALFYVASPVMAQQALTSHGAANRPDWAALLQQHQLLATRLQQLCWQYLRRYNIHTLPEDANTLLALFRTPPSQQPHYALTLAQLLALALTLSEPARQLLAEWNPLAASPPA